MADKISQDKQNRIKVIQKNVKQAYDWFRPNAERFHKCKKMIFASSLTEDDRSVASQRQLPMVEFNILEAPINRLRGEYGMQTADIVARSKNPETLDQATVDVVEGHIRSELEEANSESFEDDLYNDTLGGGYSAIKVFTEYENEESMDLKIMFNKVWDPTMCGWDILATKSHKGDGDFCYECFPMAEEEFEETYKINLKTQSFGRTLDGFNWFYYNIDKKIVMVVNYYEKVKNKVRLVKLSDDSIMKQRDYQKMIENWHDFAAPPTIKSARWTTMTEVECFTVGGNRVIEHYETDFGPYLPIIFADGNSQVIRDQNAGSNRQMTRSYIHHAIDAQRMKNFAGQILLNEIENMMQHKMMLPIDALPEITEQSDPWFNHQKASTLVYKMFDDQGRPLAPPREVQHVGIPPEISNAFIGADSIIQNILGTFDAKSINDRDLSGKAIIEGATQNNAAAMPYLMNLMASLTQLGKVLVYMIPKIYPTPRTLPVIDRDGRRAYQIVNSPNQRGSVPMNYSYHALDIRVSAATNYEVQKSKSLDAMIKLMQTMPAFNQMMNQVGLPQILDNLDINGIEQLRELARDWMKQQEQQAQHQPPSPQQQMIQLKEQELQLKGQKQQIEMAENAKETQLKEQVEILKAALAKDDLQIKRMQMLLEETRAQEQQKVENLRTVAEIQRTDEEMRVHREHQEHTHVMDKVNHLQKRREHEQKQNV